MTPLPSVNILLPIRLYSEANEHTHWRVKSKRVKDQKAWVALALKSKARSGKHLLPATVIITRYGPKMLDTDNLAGSGKAIRDAIAAWLSCGDSPADPVVWIYQQDPIKEINILNQYKTWKYATGINIAPNLDWEAPHAL